MCSTSDINNKMLDYINLSSHESILLKSVQSFYETFNCIDDFTTFINSKCKISIRMIDYFVTKYSKKNKVFYKTNDDSSFNVHQSYKMQLKCYQKRYFDPFARGTRIPYYIGDNWIITTIGQLNFFKWFISKDILEFVHKNKDFIEFDMNKNKINKIKSSKIKKIYKSNYKKIETKITNGTNQVVTNNNKCILVTF